jgi:hypothetical protein
MIEPLDLSIYEREGDRLEIMRLKKRLARIREVKKALTRQQNNALLHFPMLPSPICAELTNSLLGRYRLSDEERIATMADLIILAKRNWQGI